MKVQTMNNDKEMSINSAADAALEGKANNEAEKVFILNMETGKLSKDQNCANNFKKFQKEFDDTKTRKNGQKEQPSTRTLNIRKVQSGDYGFHITRTKWDPYPWINCIDAFSPAELAGLKVGDCVLKVNDTDVLGMRLTDIAKLVKRKSSHVTLHLWSAGFEVKCDPESLCDAPMPETLQRLSIIVQSILSIIECPVCLETISPPAMQCQNGHLLCVNCRIRAEKCPVCRDRYTPRQALIAEQIYAAITSAFNLCRNEDKLRHKLFGTNVRQRQQQKQHPHHHQQQHQQQQCENMSNNLATMSAARDKEIDSRQRRLGKDTPPPSVRNKFLMKLLHGKARSMDNLSNATTTTTATTTTIATALLTSNACLHTAETASAAPSITADFGLHRNNICKPILNVMTATNININSNGNDPPKQSTTNQLNCALVNANLATTEST